MKEFLNFLSGCRAAYIKYTGTQHSVINQEVLARVTPEEEILPTDVIRGITGHQFKLLGEYHFGVATVNKTRARIRFLLTHHFLCILGVETMCQLKVQLSTNGYCFRRQGLQLFQCVSSYRTVPISRSDLLRETCASYHPVISAMWWSSKMKRRFPKLYQRRKELSIQLVSCPP